MAPKSNKRALESLLFHPKKKPLPKQEPVLRHASSSPTKVKVNNDNATPKSSPQHSLATARDDDDDDDLNLKLPEGPYREFRVMSSASDGWKYNVMKFDSRNKSVDIYTWKAPIKLNRKQLPRRPETGGYGAKKKEEDVMRPMVGSDQKCVVGSDGRVVMVDASGRPVPIRSEEGSATGTKDSTAANGKKKSQKKTRQVFCVPEAIRQLKRDERYPWVIEDAEQKEVWVGKLEEEVSKSENHCFFIPLSSKLKDGRGGSGVFKFMPAHRWYKFQKRPNHYIPNLEEAEMMMAKIAKNKDPERWLLNNRNGRAPSAATSATFKGEEAQSSNTSLVHSSGESLGPGGKRLRMVDNGGELFQGEDDDEDDGDVTRRRRKRKRGCCADVDGDIDEVVYEDDFADDDEKVEEGGDVEEAKALEERLKREYKYANKQRDGYVDDDSDDDEEGEYHIRWLTKDGKAMKKLIRNLEDNDAYESDEEKNPYASSVGEEEEEEEPSTRNEPPTEQPPQQTPSRSRSQTLSKPSQSSIPIIQLGASCPNVSSSAAASSPAPIPSRPTPGGVSIQAKRCTIIGQQLSKIKPPNEARSPLPADPNTPSRTTDLNGCRSTHIIVANYSSATPCASAKRQGSPAAAAAAAAGASKLSKKRKAAGEVSGDVSARRLQKRRCLNVVVGVGEL